MKSNLTLQGACQWQAIPTRAQVWKYAMLRSYCPQVLGLQERVEQQGAPESLQRAGGQAVPNASCSNRGLSYRHIKR
jgi:hypothetical protein